MIEVTGQFKGEKVTLGWKDGDLLGPLPAVDALIETASGMLGRTFVAAGGDRIPDPLSDPRTFVYAAFQTLEDPSTDWEPPEEDLPAHTIP